MSDIITKVNISIGDSVLEFSGSEAFVQKQINEFKELIYGNLKPAKGKKTKGKLTGEQTDQGDDSTKDTADNQYPNVIDYNGQEIGILRTKGKTKADKTRVLALMYLWAKKQLGVKLVDKKEFVALCIQHECYDESNFKVILKKASGIAITGSGRNYSLRLTVPGLTKAKELLENLNSGDLNK